MATITLYVTDETKLIIEYAAQLSNCDLSAYILKASLKQAKLDTSRQESLILNNESRDNLLDAMKNPPEPNEDLRKLF